MNLENYTFEQLVELKNTVDSMIYSFKDGYLYLCKVRSYGRNWEERPTNINTLTELCNQYDGYDGIVDVYTTNPNLDIHNYGDVKYIKSEEDYERWYNYEQLKRLIPKIKEELAEWDNRDNVPFNQRPFFSPIYTREELVEYERKLSEYDMNFEPPVSLYKNQDDE